MTWRPGGIKEAAGLVGTGEILRILTDATRALAGEGGYDEGLHALTSILVPDVADLAAVYVRGSDARLHPRAVTRDPRAEVDGPLGADGILGQGSDHPVIMCRRVGRPVAVLRGESTGRELVSEETERTFRAGAVQGLCLPLSARGETVGVLYLLLAGTARRYGLPDLALATALAGRVAIALDNQRLLRAAQEARRAKTDFLAVMSHELRTPLTAVVGYTDLLEAEIAGPVNGEQAVQLQRIKESSWELLELIDGILDYTRFESEDPEVVREGVDVLDVVDEAVTVVRTALEEKGLEVEIRIAPDLFPLRTDRAKLRQILVHLLDNAVKFTPTGTVGVRVQADDARVRFTVTDSGPGIAPEHRERVFEPFWQGEKPETRTAGGAGIGLSLARRVADLLDGEIRVESRAGEGSAFTLLLPWDASDV